MKRSLYLVPLAALALAACTSNEPALEGQDALNPEGDQFLTININPSGSVTRADYDDGYDDDSNYLVGTPDENEVTNVRFYFFTSAGEPAMVKYVPAPDGGTESWKSYYDWNNLKPTDDADNENWDQTHNGATSNVEKYLKATIIINTSASAKDKIPYSVVAILNPDTEILGDNNLSLSNLKAKTSQHNTEELTQSGKFVMSNAIYRNASGQEVMDLPVRDHIYTSESAALSDPVEIYTERAVARLDLAIGSGEKLKPVDIPGQTNIFDTQVTIEEKDGHNLQTPEKVYVKLLGWAVTATPNKSYLFKKIDTNWDNDIFGNSEVWNNESRFRSFWAINPTLGSGDILYGNFGQGLPSGSNPDNLTFAVSEANAANLNTNFGTPAAKSKVYLEENAAHPDKSGFCDDANNSKVIIAAQLVDESGVAKPLAQWGYNYYTIDGLKTQLAKEAGVYKMTSTTTGTPGEEQVTTTTYTPITADDITFAVATSSQNEPGRYYVYPQLKNETGVQWTTSNVKGTEATTYDVVNELVKKLGRAKIWNNGYTYYYFDINHLGASGQPGYIGVVRNHIYDTTITALAGLGTPVYDPNETIYPEKPQNDDSLIAATIKILTWRLVTKTVELDW